eukprot:881496-Amphidinium_carterae.1
MVSHNIAYVNGSTFHTLRESTMQLVYVLTLSSMVDECTVSHFKTRNIARPKKWPLRCTLVSRDQNSFTGTSTDHWSQMAEHVSNDPVHDFLMHIDSARAHQIKFQRVHYTKMVHQKKEVGGKRWIRPTFVKPNRQGMRPHEVNGFVRLTQFKQWASGIAWQCLSRLCPRRWGVREEGAVRCSD